MDVGIRRRLWWAAQAFLKRSGLRLSIPGRVYLEWLLAKASRRIAREGSADDESELSRAEGAVEQLLLSATGGSPLPAKAAPLGFFAGVDYPAEPGAITYRGLRAALKDLCPGFWPFC